MRLGVLASNAGRTTALATAVLVAGASPGMGQAAQSTDAKGGPDVAAANEGQVIYKRYCAACHGKEGAGDGVLAKELRKPPKDLTQLAAENSGVFAFDKVVSAIDGRRTLRVHGDPDMPVWGEIFPKTSGTDSPSVETALERIGHYLWSIQKSRK